MPEAPAALAPRALKLALTRHCMFGAICPAQIIGRLAAQLSLVLQGKDKPIFAPHRDHGDVCIVVNAEKAVFTGNKWEGKLYKWHTGGATVTKGLLSLLAAARASAWFL